MAQFAGNPGGSAGFHVALDTMMGRRDRFRPEEVTIDGFLLLDTCEYELVTAHVPLDVFWKMKALDIVGNTRSMNRARAARPEAHPEVGSVWLVDATLEGPYTTSEPPFGLESRPAHSAAGPADMVFQLRIHAVHALERVAIEASGPRLIEVLRVGDMLPAIDLN